MIATADYELATREAGVAERPHRTLIELNGSEAAEFLQGQVTNDIEALEPGSGVYAALLDHKGKLRTDMRVLRLASDRLLVDAPTAGHDLLIRTFETYSLGRDVRHSDLTGERELLSLIGPAADALLDAAPESAEHAVVEGEHGAYVRTDLGVDVITADPDAVRALAPPIEDAVAECLRIESGRPLLGLDMDGSTIPQEAGLNERAVSFTKGCYVGQETVARLHYRGKPNRHLRGLLLDAPAAPGESIVFGEKQVGSVGSSCESPRLGLIALALVRREAEPGARVDVGEGSATVVELPFEER